MTLPQNPVFKRCFHLTTLSTHHLLLYDDLGNQHLLEGRIYALLAPYLAATHSSLDTITDALQHEVSPAEIYYALMRLERQGLIIDAIEPLTNPFLPFYDLLGVAPSLANRRLENSPLAVTAMGDLSPDLFYTIAREYPLHFSPAAAIQIVVTDQISRPELQEWNRKALATNQSWLLIKSVGPEIWIGPLFIPGATACFTCLHDRYRINRTEAWLQNQTIHAPRIVLPFGPEIAYRIAINELFKWIVLGGSHSLQENLLVYDVISSTLTPHAVRKRPQCRECGNPPQWEPLLLKRHQYSVTEDGGFRSVTPEETYRTYQHLISPITGILSGLTPLSSSPHAHSYTAEFAGGAHGAPYLQWSRRGSGGKGVSDGQSKASCLGEAIERHSGIFRGEERCEKRSFLSFQGDAIDPRRCLLFSEEQYRTREAWNQQADLIHQVPRPFDEQEEIDWSPAWSLTENRSKWILTAYGYYAYPAGGKELPCRGDSNGCASGNTKEEAILQGLFELIERDSIAIWWYNRLRAPRVDWHAIDDPKLSSFKRYYTNLECDVWVLDLTFDLGIPVFTAISEKSGDIALGFGAHLHPKIALFRALTELNLSLDHTLFRRTSLKEQLPGDRRHAIEKFTAATRLEKQLYLYPAPHRVSPIQFGQLNYPKDITEAILFCQKILERKGMELLVLDQTRPDIGMPVVKVIVPGLRHFWHRLAPGRLYDVPRDIGALPQCFKEDELHKIPMFF